MRELAGIFASLLLFGLVLIYTNLLNWKILNLICVKKSPADIRLYKKSDLLENRLKDEYLGYLKPIKQN